jgi:hypothetical protein
MSFPAFRLRWLLSSGPFPWHFVIIFRYPFTALCLDRSVCSYFFGLNVYVGHGSLTPSFSMRFSSIITLMMVAVNFTETCQYGAAFQHTASFPSACVLSLSAGGELYLRNVNSVILRYIFLNNKFYSHEIWYVCSYRLSVPTDFLSW